MKIRMIQNDERLKAFTIVEVVAALGLLTLMLSSVMVLMNRYVDAVMDMQLREQAFELARSNMEQLLAESKLSDMAEYGTSEINPDIEWETLVEPFYEPVTDRMWIRAVCSAGFNDSKSEFQQIELEHWITNLTPAQIKQILAQQKVEAEYLELLGEGDDSAIQETTSAYLKEQGLDYQSYERFAEQQRRKKLEYITEKGFDGYEEYLQTLVEEENRFLEDQGMNFDGYNEFATAYVPEGRDMESLLADIYNESDGFSDTDLPGDQTTDPKDSRDTPERPRTDVSSIDWNQVPPELVPLLEQMFGIQQPKR